MDTNLVGKQVGKGPILKVLVGHSAANERWLHCTLHRICISVGVMKTKLISVCLVEQTNTLKMGFYSKSLLYKRTSHLSLPG